MYHRKRKKTTTMMMKINLSLIIIFFLIPSGLIAQKSTITLSGTTKDKVSNEALSFVAVVTKHASDSSFTSGTITNEEGLFTLTDLKPGEYVLELSMLGYKKYSVPLFVGSNSDYLNLGVIFMSEDTVTLGEVEITAKQDAVSSKMDKKTYSIADNISQSGGSIMQSMQNLPGVTVQDGQVLLRGSNQIMVLIDGKQTAITGFGNQNGLDNLPASSVEKIEIINNPSAKYDGNGNA
ncbi:MAG: TonB-dependent receptor, partial [Bacteroidetes bacterium]|nr:TonB-dependent receptor [Bacteroidota bacterium]